MLFIRSALFNVLFYVNIVVLMTAALATLVLPGRWGIIAMTKVWARTSLWLLRVVCGTRFELRGAEKIPRGGLLVAAKHQSVWETFALLPLIEDPAFILKRELMWLPLFGWEAWKAQQIPVDRGAGAQTLPALVECARAALREGRQIVIFPEGTRRAPGAEPAYKYGVARLYRAGDVPCVPIALNSGLFWPRRSFLRYPGTIMVEILDPIPPGLEPRAFFERLQADIETATARLVADSRRRGEGMAEPSPNLTAASRASPDPAHPRESGDRG